MLPRKVCKSLQGYVLNTLSKLVPAVCTWDLAAGLRWYAQELSWQTLAEKHRVPIRNSCWEPEGHLVNLLHVTNGEAKVQGAGGKSPPRLPPTRPKSPSRALHSFSFRDSEQHPSEPQVHPLLFPAKRPPHKMTPSHESLPCLFIFRVRPSPLPRKVHLWGPPLGPPS